MTVIDPAIAAGVLAFVLVALLTEVMRRIAIRHRVLDQPRADRCHQRATPQLGGVAILGGTLSAFALSAHAVSGQMAAIIGAAAAVSILGLIDDLRPLNPALRLTTEFLAASALVLVGVHADLLASAGAAGRCIDAAGTVIWIVALTNSFNLLDNSDGAVAAIVLVTSPLLAVVALAAGRAELAALLIAMAAGCAGFLAHNWAPARIFMGDAGSLFLGFLLATSAVLTCTSGGAGTRAPIAAAACALLLLVFVAVVDTSTVIVSRQRAGLPWTRGGADHIAHRLQAAGLSPAQAAISLSAAATVTGVFGLIVLTGLVPAVAALVGTTIVGVTLVTLAQRVTVYGHSTSAPADSPQKSLSTRQAGSIDRQTESRGGRAALRFRPQESYRRPAARR